MGIRSDLTLFRTAINNGYPITNEMREDIVLTACKIKDDPLSNNRERLAAMRLLISADAANKSIDNSGMEEILLKVAEMAGVKDDVLRLVGEGEGSGNSSSNS